jgi:hypothetical protein
MGTQLKLPALAKRCSDSKPLALLQGAQTTAWLSAVSLYPFDRGLMWSRVGKPSGPPCPLCGEPMDDGGHLVQRGGPSSPALDLDRDDGQAAST